MASDLIRLDKQGMEGVISRTKMAKENYDMAIQSLKRIIEGLNDVWVGEAQRGMYERYKDSEKTFAAFSDEIGEYINALQKTLAELPGKDSENAQMIRRLM
ncbi:MAG: hypothetical protein V8R85_01960 [Frisingicoccus sp.]